LHSQFDQLFPHSVEVYTPVFVHFPVFLGEEGGDGSLMFSYFLNELGPVLSTNSCELLETVQQRSQVVMGRRFQFVFFSLKFFFGLLF
jgi:hypothetical protein